MKPDWPGAVFGRQPSLRRHVQNVARPVLFVEAHPRVFPGVRWVRGVHVIVKALVPSARCLTRRLSAPNPQKHPQKPNCQKQQTPTEPFHHDVEREPKD